MKKSDVILAGAVFFTAGILCLLQKSGEAAGGNAVVWQGQERIASYPLYKDRTETIQRPAGGRNILVIKGGEVYMEDADCPDRLCVKQGRIARTGQTITCLPHRLSVTIEDGQEPELDGVTGRRPERIRNYDRAET